MTNPEVKRQKQLARQRQKLKDKTRRAQADKAAAAQRQKVLATTAPIRDCLVPADLYEHGLGQLVFSRALPDGRIAMAIFLVDIFCLGVKNALHATLESDVYAERIGELTQFTRYEPMPPACFRKLVEGAVAYARSLGLAPHADYAVARQIFGAQEVASCEHEFVYGRNGKPFYVAGPNETPSQSRAILEQVRRHVGDADHQVQVGSKPVE